MDEDGDIFPDREVGLDLNDDRVVSEMECADLREHIRDAREAYHTSLAELSQRETIREIAARGETGVFVVPQIDLGEIFARDKAARIAMSQLILALEASRKNNDYSALAVSVHGTAAVKMSKGERPHGYPTTLEKQLEHLGTRLASSAMDLDEQTASIADMVRRFTLIRRDYEAVVDGLRELI